MASIGTDPGGFRRILFVAPDGKRKTIRLGKCPQRFAESFKLRVEQLLAANALNQPPDSELTAWLARLDSAFVKKLAVAGLIEAPQDEQNASSVKLGAFLDSWQATRKNDYKPASLIAWGQVIDAMKAFFGTDCPIASVTATQGEAFRQSMVNAGLRATTIHKRLQTARMVFSHAKRQSLVSTNPFEYIRHRPGDASERRAYVPAEDVERVIEFAPNVTWKLLIALSRFAGLRVPSEALSLRWQDVDWERERLTVPSPKTQHLAGRAYRVIPLFPAIRPFLDAAWEQAPEGAVYVIPEEYRRRAQGPGGWANANLRTTFEKIIRRAGLESWPRLWHSMRASCETDLARKFPLAVVAKWLGNTQAVAMRHYVDVTDADFEKAIQTTKTGSEKAAQNPAQFQAVLNRRELQSGLCDIRKSPEKQHSAVPCSTVQVSTLEAGGIEPPSRGVATWASTRVSGDLSLTLVVVYQRNYHKDEPRA